MEVLLYKNLAQEIINKIESGEYALNTKIPSENDLCDMYGVSKSTASKATQLLIREGYVYSIPKSGCYVANNNGKVFEIEHSPYLEQLNKANNYMLIAFSIDEGEEPLPQIFKYDLLFKKDEEPVFVSRASVSLPRSVDLSLDALNTTDLSTFISDNHDIFTADRKLVISAERADKSLAGKLNIKEGETLFTTTTVYTDVTGYTFARIKAYYTMGTVILTSTSINH